MSVFQQACGLVGSLTVSTGSHMRAWPPIETVTLMQRTGPPVWHDPALGLLKPNVTMPAAATGAMRWPRLLKLTTPKPGVVASRIFGEPSSAVTR
jgi:hypothetical protein